MRFEARWICHPDQAVILQQTKFVINSFGHQVLNHHVYYSLPLNLKRISLQLEMHIVYFKSQLQTLYKLHLYKYLRFKIQICN